MAPAAASSMFASTSTSASHSTPSSPASPKPYGASSPTEARATFEWDEKPLPHDSGLHISHNSGQVEKPIKIQRQVEVHVLVEERAGLNQGSAMLNGNYTGVWSGPVDAYSPPTRSVYFGDHIHQNKYTAP